MLMLENARYGGPMSRDPLQDTLVEGLISRARDGDQAARDELFRHYRPIFRAWARQRLRKEERRSGYASDVAQETARRAFERFVKFRGSKKSELDAWLRRILKNCILEMDRSAGRQKRDERVTVPLDSKVVKSARAQEMSPSQNAARGEDYHNLLVHLFHLPDDQREAIWLRELKELTVAEVAKQMDKTEAAIRGLLVRGLNALRTRMNRGTSGDPDVDLTESSSKSETEIAIISYMQLTDAVDEFDREAFLAEHASCADELRAMLDFIDRIQAIWDDDPASEE